MSFNNMEFEFLKKLCDADDRLRLREHAYLLTSLINHRDEETGNTLLIRATERGQSQVVASLLELGANPRITSITHETALHVACSRHDLHLAKMLVLAGANVDARDGYNFTPLIRATQDGHLDMVELLLSHGATINEPTLGMSLDTPLHIACFNHHPRVVRYLVRRGSNLNATNSNGNTALMLCIQQGFQSLASYLIEQGAEVNVRNRCYLQRTPLHLACDGKHLNTDLVQKLVEKQAEINVQDSAGFTSLMLAVNNSDVQTSEYLVGVGADVNMVNGRRQSALMLASSRGYSPLIPLLLSHGADVNLSDLNGHTCATIIFFYYKNKAWTTASGTDPRELLTSLRLLLNHGAHIDIRDHKGFTLHDYVRQGNFLGRWCTRQAKFLRCGEEEERVRGLLLDQLLPLPLSCLACRVLAIHTAHWRHTQRCPTPLVKLISMHHPTKFYGPPLPSYNML